MLAEGFSKKIWIKSLSDMAVRSTYLVQLFLIFYRYMDIMEKIPHELKQEWHYAKILEKLGKFGLVRTLLNLIAADYSQVTNSMPFHTG